MDTWKMDTYCFFYTHFYISFKIIQRFFYQHLKFVLIKIVTKYNANKYVMIGFTIKTNSLLLVLI